MDITVHSQPLFVTSLAITKLNNYNREKVIENILDLEKNTKSSLKSNAGGWQSQPYNYTNYDNIFTQQLFDDNINPVLKQISYDWGFHIKTSGLSYWYNVNRKYNYNHQHYHPTSVLSGVLYLKVPSNSGRIVFLRAPSEADRMDFLTAYQSNNDCFFPDNSHSNTIHYKVPEENLLFIFPSHLEHYVEQNLTADKDDIRISLSFNYFI